MKNSGTYVQKARTVIVTISREYGAAGLAVADGVAHALGYELLTDELPPELAARLGGDPPLSERLLSGLVAATPEVVGAAQPGGWAYDDEVRAEVEATMRARAAHGDVVILGHLGNAVLAGMEGLVRVFLTASVAWRTDRIVETFGLARERATAEIERTDAARRRAAKERYKFTWSDPRYYDLVVDTARFGIEGTIEVIALAVRTAEGA